jgi:hypothetical protein
MRSARANALTSTHAPGSRRPQYAARFQSLRPAAMTAASAANVKTPRLAYNPRALMAALDACTPPDSPALPPPPPPLLEVLEPAPPLGAEAVGVAESPLLACAGAAPAPLHGARTAAQSAAFVAALQAWLRGSLPAASYKQLAVHPVTLAKSSKALLHSAVLEAVLKHSLTMSYGPFATWAREPERPQVDSELPVTGTAWQSASRIKASENVPTRSGPHQTHNTRLAQSKRNVFGAQATHVRW